MARWSWRAACAAAILVQLVVLYAPSTRGPGTFPGADKLVHATVFAAVGFTAVRAGWPRVPVFGVLVAHAVISEVVQHLVLPGRSGDPLDAVADIVGAGIGVLLAAWRRPPAPS